MHLGKQILFNSLWTKVLGTHICTFNRNSYHFKGCRKRSSQYLLRKGKLLSQNFTPTSNLLTEVKLCHTSRPIMLLGNHRHSKLYHASCLTKPTPFKGTLVPFPQQCGYSTTTKRITSALLPCPQQCGYSTAANQMTSALLPRPQHCRYSSAANWMTSGLEVHVDKLMEEHQRLNQQLMSADDNQDISPEVLRRLSEMAPLMRLVETYNNNTMQLHDTKVLITGENDAEMVAMATEECEQLEQNQAIVRSQILNLLIPREVEDNLNDIIMEVTSGVGGQEAMLFTDEIFTLYQLYAYHKGWSFAPLGERQTDLGGVKRASAIISGEGVYRRLKYEAGVHRVQRVPRTEKGGRMHTSTMTVAILPQPQQIEVVLRPDDIHFEAFRASGAGGQHVNTTSSAVRIKHLPTGMVAECQTSRSQHSNRAEAMRVLASRIYQKQLDAQRTKVQSQRKLQVGTAGRSDKIRTYNFAQDRITDHRIAVNINNITNFMTSGEAFDELVEQLLDFEWKESVEEFFRQSS